MFHQPLESPPYLERVTTIGGLLRLVEQSRRNIEHVDKGRSDGEKQVGAEPEFRHVSTYTRSNYSRDEVRFLLDCHENDVGIMAGVPQLPRDLNTTQAPMDILRRTTSGHRREYSCRTECPLRRVPKISYSLPSILQTESSIAALSSVCSTLSLRVWGTLMMLRAP